MGGNLIYMVNITFAKWPILTGANLQPSLKTKRILEICGMIVRGGEILFTLDICGDLGIFNVLLNIQLLKKILL